MTLSQRVVLIRLQKDAVERRFHHECMAKNARENLKAVNKELAKLDAMELKATMKSMKETPPMLSKTAARAGLVKPRVKLHVCKKHGYMLGVSKDGKTEYGPGKACWQCQHRDNGGKGGHKHWQCQQRSAGGEGGYKHSCGKVPYAR